MAASGPGVPPSISNVLGELLVELLVIIFPLRDFREHFQALNHEVLLDHAKNLTLLQSHRTS